MAAVTLHPFLYTRDSGGLLGGAGFQFMRWSAGLTTRQLSQLERSCFYDRPDRMESVHDPALLPRALWRTALEDGFTAVGRTTYADSQSATRGGNFVAAGFVYLEDELEAVGFDAFAIFRSNVEFPGTHTLAQSGTRLAPRTLDLRPGVGQRTWTDPPFRSRIEALLGALILAPTDGGQVVTVAADVAANEALAEALVALMPPAARRLFTFRTWLREPRGSFHLMGTLPSEQVAREVGTWARSYMVLHQDAVVRAPPTIPAAARWIAKAYEQGGFSAASATHAWLEPLGADLTGAQNDIVADVACDRSLSPAEALARLAKVPADHRALPTLAPGLLERRAQELAAPAGVAEVAELVEHASRLAESVGLPNAQLLVQRLVGGIRVPAPPGAWAALLAAMSRDPFVPSPGVWDAFAVGIAAGEPARQDGWVQFLRGIRGAAEARVPRRVDLCRVLGGVLVAAEPTPEFLRAFDEALACVLVIDADSAAWAAALTGLNACLEPEFADRWVTARVVGAWTQLRASGEKATRRVRTAFLRLMIEWEGSQQWVTELCADHEVLADQVLGLLDELQTDDPAARARVASASWAIRRRWPNGDRDSRARQALAQRGWFPALETELWASNKPTSEALLSALTGVTALDGPEPELTALLDRWLDGGHVGAVERAAQFWETSAAAPAPQGSELNHRLLLRLLRTPLAGTELFAKWSALRLRVQGIPAASGDSRTIVDQLDRLWQLHSAPAVDQVTAVERWEVATARAGSDVAAVCLPAEAFALAGWPPGAGNRRIAGMLGTARHFSEVLHARCVEALVQGARYRGAPVPEAAVEWLTSCLRARSDIEAIHLARALRATWGSDAALRAAGRMVVARLRRRQVEIEGHRGDDPQLLDQALTSVADGLGVADGAGQRMARRLLNAGRRARSRRASPGRGDPDEGGSNLLAGVGVGVFIVAVGLLLLAAALTAWPELLQGPEPVTYDATFEVRDAEWVRASCPDQPPLRVESSIAVVRGLPVGADCSIEAGGPEGSHVTGVRITRGGTHRCELLATSLRCSP